MKTHVAVWAALLALLAATVGAYWLPLGRFNVAVGLAIACAKALLVAAYFMHLRFQKRVVWVWSAAGCYWLGIMLALTLADFLTRGWDG
jgi:cytochrome c oxidase subunit 4